jgi:hypothetical protein
VVQLFFMLRVVAAAAAGGAAAVSVPAAVPIPVTVSPTLVLNPAVSRLIFGANCAIGAVLPPSFNVSYPVCRWGGNAVTRYNYLTDSSNHASDWFFMNLKNAPGPDGSSSFDAFMASCGASNSSALVTLPTIGFVACTGGVWGPNCATPSWGFSVSKYSYIPASTECSATGNASWCNKDAGNGIVAGSGKAVTGNDPADTSVPTNASFAVDFAAHALGLGHLAPAQVEFALDNEPELWDSTHRDVHPAPTTYDELWAMTLAYGSALKAAFPDSLIHGPIPWGWCAYFSSAADSAGCVSGPDREAHGGIPILQWLLTQVAAHKAATGVQLLDVLDVHYYPQSCQSGGDANETEAAIRLRAPMSLYNESYVDESWVNEPVALLRRLANWTALASQAGGAELDVRVAVSEFAFGPQSLVSTALAHAEALAVFAREGVYQASVWTQPTPGSIPGETPWRMFLNYDGLGATLAAGGAAVGAASADAEKITVYAYLQPPGAAQQQQQPLLQLLLFSKAPPSVGSVNVSVAIDWTGAGSGGDSTVPVSGWRFGADSPALQPLSPSLAPVPCGPTAPALELTLPPWSATLLTMPYACPAAAE